MPAVDVTDYHVQIRDAVLAALSAAVPELDCHALDDLDDAGRLTVPCVAAACVGPESEAREFSTNQRTGMTYPVAVMALGAGTAFGEKSQAGVTLTQFRRLVDTLFHLKRLAGVPEVAQCEVSDSGPLVDEKSPAFQRLATAMVVAATGRFPRA